MKFAEAGGLMIHRKLDVKCRFRFLTKAGDQDPMMAFIPVRYVAFYCLLYVVGLHSEYIANNRAIYFKHQ